MVTSQANTFGFGREFLAELLDSGLLPLALIREDEFAAFPYKRLRDCVSETPLIRNPED